MHRRLCLMLLLGACARPTSTTPRLVVLVVVDQLPSWSFLPREKLFHGGFARLLHEGTLYATGRYPYAATFTAPGHAALGTGAPPSETGIICNEWWDRDDQAFVESVNDGAYPMLVVDGWPGELATSRTRASASRLRVDGLGDAMHASRGGRSVGVSLKNRAAIFPLGRHGDLAVWYDEGQRAFTTSTWFAHRVPPWLIELNRTHPIGIRLADPWEPLDAAILAREAGSDDGPGESSNSPFGRTFPHLPMVLADPGSAIKMTPLGDTVVLEAALAAARGEHLGEHDVPDLLVVSFSATDYVGHDYGQESWEMLDMMLRLDRDLGQLMDGLEAQVGKGRVTIVLTSDHGAPRMPDRVEHGVRVKVDDVRRAINSPYVESWREPSIYFNRAFHQLPPREQDQLLESATIAIRSVDGIGYAFRKDKLPPPCDGYAPLEASVCRSIDGERSGEILFGPRPGSLIQDKENDPLAHGSPNEEDTTVPVIIWGPGIPHARHEEAISMLQVAPTLAVLLGVPPPTHAKAAPLMYGKGAP